MDKWMYVSVWHLKRSTDTITNSCSSWYLQGIYSFNWCIRISYRIRPQPERQRQQRTWHRLWWKITERSRIQMGCIWERMSCFSVRNTVISYVSCFNHSTEYTDDVALKWLQRTKESTDRLTRWSMKQAYHFTIHHKPRVTNQNADALSRPF